jgi:hypothetical protein
MENQHLLIVGCRDLGKGDIDLINEVKKMANLVRVTVEKIELSAVSRRQLRVRSGGTARIGYAALVLRSTLEVDRARPSAVLSTHRSR